MFRSVIVVVVTIALSGCVKPMEPLSVDRRAARDMRVKVEFASMIANRSTVGTPNLFFGDREYRDARIAIVRSPNESIQKMCAEVFVKNVDFFGSREVDLMVDVSETNDNVALRMPKDISIFGSSCDGPFEPFPELQRLSPRTS